LGAVIDCVVLAAVAEGFLDGLTYGDDVHGRCSSMTAAAVGPVPVWRLPMGPR
jgi:hypothetical protein